MTIKIEFYSTGDEYGEFSNFATYPLRIDGATWPTAEHYFQAQKFDDRALREKIRMAKTAAIAAKMGRDRSNKLRRGWESGKIAVMRKALWEKFSQHPDLGKLLIGTGEAVLIEHTQNDDYWGDGGNGRGKNMLGRLLMEVRLKLQDNPI
jgi:ribA/ribD-fused uncharacterized protein